MFNKLGYKAMLVASILTLSACAEEGPAPIDKNAPDVSTSGANRPIVSIFDTAVATETFTTLITALQTTGLDTDFADESKTFTVFVPTDSAFEALGTDAINDLLADPEALRNLLQYHFVADQVIGLADATGAESEILTMANGDNTALTYDGDSFWINSSKVIVTDVIATNGIIHVVDTVLTPPEDEPSPMNVVEAIAANGAFTVFHEALVSTGLADTLSNTDDTFTVFAPTDEAFAKIPDEIKNALLADTQRLDNMLRYHVIGGEAVDTTTAISLSGQQKGTSNGANVAMYLINGKLNINEATVINSDLWASNGVIHALDSVLTPPAHLVDVPDAHHVAVSSILDIARNTPDYSIFASAVEVANLDGALGSPIDLYTVFLPTNAAFKALDGATRDHLFSNPMAMRNVVLRHMLPGRVLDSTVAIERIGFNLQSGNGDYMVITQQADSLWVEDAKIRTADITTVNGIIHTIDKVLLPR